MNPDLLAELRRIAARLERLPAAAEAAHFTLAYLVGTTRTPFESDDPTVVCEPLAKPPLVEPPVGHGSPPSVPKCSSGGMKTAHDAIFTPAGG